MRSIAWMTFLVSMILLINNMNSVSAAGFKEGDVIWGDISALSTAHNVSQLPITYPEFIFPEFKMTRKNVGKSNQINNLVNDTKREQVVKIEFPTNRTVIQAYDTPEIRNQVVNRAVHFWFSKENNKRPTLLSDIVRCQRNTSMDSSDRYGGYVVMLILNPQVGDASQFSLSSCKVKNLIKKANNPYYV